MPSKFSDLGGELFCHRFYNSGTMQRSIVPRFADPIGVLTRQVVQVDLVLVAPVGSHREILDESERRMPRACQ